MVEIRQGKSNVKTNKEWHGTLEPRSTTPLGFRLVHAVGNNETFLAYNLSEFQYQTQKRIAIDKIEHEAGSPIITRDGKGSVTCIEEEFYLDPPDNARADAAFERRSPQ